MRAFTLRSDNMTIEELTITILNLCDTLIDSIIDDDEDEEDLETLLCGSRNDNSKIQVEIKIIKEDNNAK